MALLSFDITWRPLSCYVVIYYPHFICSSKISGPFKQIIGGTIFFLQTTYPPYKTATINTNIDFWT